MPLELFTSEAPVEALACGSEHCALVLSSGEVYTWGRQVREGIMGCHLRDLAKTRALAIEGIVLFWGLTRWHLHNSVPVGVPITQSESRL